jgi:hypothetical protein
MKTVNVAATATKIADAGNRRFCHIYNNSDTTIYVKYDGDETALTTANGVPIAPGEKFGLDNDGINPIFVNEIWGIHGSSGTKEVRCMGI